MFTKTSLNKIKKADLVQMYLDLQAKDYDEKMEQTLEKCCNNAIEEAVKSMKDVIEEVKAENEKLKKEIKEYEYESNESGVKEKKLYEQAFAIQAERDRLKKENESQKVLIVNETIEKEKLQTEVEKLKKQIEDLQDEKQKMSSMAYANGLDINPTDEDLGWMGLADEEEYEKKEDDTIKEKNESRQKIPDDVIGAFERLAGSWWDDEARFYREHFDPEEDPELMGTDELEPCNYTDLRVISDFFNPN